MRCPSGCSHPEQYSAEATLDLPRCHQSVSSGVLPREPCITDDWASQPQLPACGSNEPAPSVGCIRVARAYRRPAKGLFEETEGVLHGETPQVPMPEDAQVSAQRPADPSQPQWVGWQLFVGQPFD